VATSASPNHGIDIKAVHKIFPRTQYRPESSPGLVFRLKRPKTATLIFRSGKMVCTETKKEADVYFAVEKLRRNLDEHNAITYGERRL